MSNFKVGDRVRIKGEPAGAGYTFTKIGSEGIILSLDILKARVKFSKMTGKQPKESEGDGDTWDIALHNIEIIRQPELQPQPKSPYRRIVL